MANDIVQSRAGADLRLRQGRAWSNSPARSPSAASNCCRPAARRRRSRGAGLAVVDVAQITGFPEMMDGRVKTLHPRVHGGLLAIRSEPAHQAAMIANDIAPIDLLIVNLYPFEATLKRGASFDETDREYRHRRPGDDPRRGQEPR